MPNETDNRARILDAAERLFATRGYAATSVREIVREAEVTNPMLYYYFGSKEDLFLHLLRDRFQSFQDLLAEQLPAEPDARTFLMTWACTVLEAVSERSTSIRFIYAAIYGPNEGIPYDAILEQHATLDTFMTNTLKRALPEAAHGRVEFVKFLFDSLTSHLLFFRLAGGLPGDPTELAGPIVDRALAAISDDLPILEFADCHE